MRMRVRVMVKVRVKARGMFPGSFMIYGFDHPALRPAVIKSGRSQIDVVFEKDMFPVRVGRRLTVRNRKSSPAITKHHIRMPDRVDRAVPFCTAAGSCGSSESVAAKGGG